MTNQDPELLALLRAAEDVLARYATLADCRACQIGIQPAFNSNLGEPGVVQTVEYRKEEK
jgi:hypothetical protein